MKRLKITVKEIDCRDPQDPKYDELYFVTAVNNRSQVSDTIVGVRRGEKASPEAVIFEAEVNEQSPILITAVERRGAKDSSLVAAHLERLAGVGIDIAQSRMKVSSDKSDAWAAVAAFLLEQVIGIFKALFRDTPLMAKVITEPYAPDVSYPVEYVMSGKQETFPTYGYSVKLEMEYN